MKFNDFVQIIPHSTKIYTDETIHECGQKYNCFICGGDQIWNKWDTHTDESIDAFTLQFVPDERYKFSYAPSLPSANISDEFAQKLRKGIKRLNAISVRESLTLKYIELLSEKKAITVVDPVLLLSCEQWDKIAVMPEVKSKYIVCYFLGTDIKLRKTAKALANRLHMKLLTFPHIFGTPQKCDLNFGDIKCYDAGPKEFIGLIKSCELVLTDSFHACVFSLIYNKNFYVFPRATIVGNATMNNRIVDFLAEYGLEEQFISIQDADKITNVPTIDYSMAMQRLEENRKISFQFLDTQFEKIL